MSKYFVVASLDCASFLVYSDNRQEYKLKRSRATKIVIKLLMLDKNIPLRVVVNQMRFN